MELSMFRASTACRSARTRRLASRLVWVDGRARLVSPRTVATVALGFGAIGRACRITAAGELSLLRMALDTIVYALERHSMEQGTRAAGDAPAAGPSHGNGGHVQQRHCS